MTSARTSLPCGCYRGRLACEEALDLLRAFALSYAEGIRTGHWYAFDRLRDAVEAHYASQSARDGETAAPSEP